MALFRRVNRCIEWLTNDQQSKVTKFCYRLPREGKNESIFSKKNFFFKNSDSF